MSDTSERSALSKDLFLADLQSFEEAIWRNEEIGEKRFSFFITLVTAVAAGLVALWSADYDELTELRRPLTWTASLVLLIFGLISYMRMIHRDRVTAEYKDHTHFIRNKYRATFRNECPALRDYKLPMEWERELRGGHSVCKKYLRRVRQAGYTQSLAVLNGALFAATLGVATSEVGPAIFWGFVLAIGLSLFGSHEHGPKGKPTRTFRAGVGAVITDGQGRVLVGERRDTARAWQFPQGGLEAGEKPIDAVLREIEEETGIRKDALERLGRYPELLAYELPPEAQSEKTDMGQVQYWFFFRLKPGVDPGRPPANSEFRGLDWVPFHTAVTGVVGFKKPLYRKLQEYFEGTVSNEADTAPAQKAGT